MAELAPDDLRQLADLCAQTLASLPEDGWESPVPGLEWSAYETLFHLMRVPLNYASHLATRAVSPIPFRIGSLVERSDGSPAGALTTIAAMRTFCFVLADVVEAAPPGTRAFHQAGRADRSGFIAMACDELLIHTDDILRSTESYFQPPEDPVARVLARLFPWAPTDVDPWKALRWANGREELRPPHGRLGPDWTWHCAPLEEWDRSVPRMGGS
jgi:Mycothiol maleylpyruvate isomerase N-terminal domain